MLILVVLPGRRRGQVEAKEVARMPDLGRTPGSVIMQNTVEVDLLWNTAGGKAVRNILHATVATAFTATPTISQAVFAAITSGATWTAYAAFLHSTAQMAGVQIKDVRNANSAYAVSTGLAVAGTGAGAALPAGVAAVCNLKTLFAGRHYRGRVYLPGLDSSALVAATGIFLGTFQTAAQNWMALVQSALNTSGMTLAIGQPARLAYTGRKGALHPATPSGSTAVNQMIVRLQPFEQRRRNLVA